ncbi:MAG: ADP-ribosylglycohydrolase family protein, partial [Elusimicrobia bacterium]|nr:ADP-ribosylglycohydrolase family protein [Elusimicrobiota bacterium]
MEPLERVRGMFLGLAVGDALGMPTEFLSFEQIRQRFGPEGLRDFVNGKGMFTD